MSGIIFSWDDRKERENSQKHGISFEEATTVFADESARLKHDSSAFFLASMPNFGYLLLYMHIDKMKLKLG